MKINTKKKINNMIICENLYIKLPKNWKMKEKTKKWLKVKLKIGETDAFQRKNNIKKNWKQPNHNIKTN